MKKSQVLSALALTYVAGVTIAPVSNIYAEAVVTDDCHYSASEAEAAIITSDDIANIISDIQKLDLYDLYQKAQNVKDSYNTKVEHNGTEMTLAESIDQALADADVALNGVNGLGDTDGAIYDVKAANDAIGNATTLSNLATMLKDLMNEGKITPEPYQTPADFAELVDDAQDKAPFYDEYHVLIKAVVAGNDLEAIRTAARTVNAARVNAGLDPEFASTDAVLKTTSTISDIRTSLGNATAHPAYIKPKRIYDLTGIAANQAKMTALREAKDALAEAQEEFEKADVAKTDAMAQIQAVFDRFTSNGIRVKNFSPRSNVADFVELIGGAFHGNQNNIIIDHYDEWTALSIYLDGIEADPENDNSDLADEIKVELNKFISDADIINGIFDPVSNHKVCSADGSVAVRGMLPDKKLIVKIEKATNADFETIFNNNAKVIYDITIEYKGASYSNALVGDYEVVVKVPTDMVVESVHVLYVNGGTYQNVEVLERDAANGTITFKTNHFSHYALVGDQAPKDDGFGGYDEDSDFNVDGPDDSFGGHDTDEGFTFNPVVSVLPGEEEVKTPVVDAPNTGIATATSTTGNANATAGIVAGFIAMATAAVAAIVRIVRREA